MTPWNKIKARTKHHIVGVAVALVAMAAAFFLTAKYPPGMFSYLVALPACGLIMLTSLARVNDISPERIGWRWQLRRIGLCLTGAGATAVAAGPFTMPALYPSWIGTMILIGIAATWFTTPGLPPWSSYVFGDMVASPQKMGD